MGSLTRVSLAVGCVVLMMCCGQWLPTAIAQGSSDVAIACASIIDDDPETRNANQQRISPKLSAEELTRLQLLDVRITSVTHVDEKDNPNAPVTPSPTSPAFKAHTKVDGVIGGTIRFELLLPDEWNGRFVMGGGGGFVGRVSNFIRGSVNSGYATAGTDTGHQSPGGISGEWALDDLEALVNYGYLAVHRTALASKAIIAAQYGQPSEYCYFYGCSTGGGQALIEAQRYPEDFDGIISAAPVVQHSGLAAARLYNAQKFFPDPTNLTSSIISEQQLMQLHQAVMDACDEQDGVRDGMLADPRACRFDLSQLDWLTPVQRDALQALYDGPSNETGQIYPGMPLGSENRWHTWKSGANPGLLTRSNVPNPGFAMGVDFCRYFVFNDPDWNYSTYDMAHWQRDSHRIGKLLDANNPDLSAFRKSGGKLILWHGWNDGPLTPLASIEYYEHVERLDPDLRDFFRFYLLPGVTHCRGGVGPDRVDWLNVLRDWVEDGVAPERLIAKKIDVAGRITMTRPIHPYPLQAVYTGTGSTDDAENFVLPTNP